MDYLNFVRVYTHSDVVHLFYNIIYYNKALYIFVIDDLNHLIHTYNYILCFLKRSYYYVV